MPDIIIASPWDTFHALLTLFMTQSFWYHVTITTMRVSLGVIIGGVAGFILGMAAGLNDTIKYLLEPLRWTLLSIPAVVFVVIAMLWFGMGNTMVVVMTAVFLSPIVYVGVVSGLEMVDTKYLNMVQVYKLSFPLTLRHLYLPAIMSNLASSMRMIVGTGVRVVILAEVMGTADGLGHSISLSRTNLETPALFGYVLICIALVGIVEYALLRPAEDRLTQWKHGESA
jgi:NitT/TauT family transport system permease protein